MNSPMPTLQVAPGARQADAPPPLPSAQPPAPGQTHVRFAPAAVETAVGGPVQVSVQIDNAADLFSASQIRVKYDASILKLNDIAPGDLFTGDGVRITSVKDIRNEVGEATLTVARTPGTKGVSGPGPVVMLNFTAIGKGTATVKLPEVDLKNSQLQPVTVTSSELPVKVN